MFSLRRSSGSGFRSERLGSSGRRCPGSAGARSSDGESSAPPAPASTGAHLASIRHHPAWSVPRTEPPRSCGPALLRRSALSDSSGFRHAKTRDTRRRRHTLSRHDRQARNTGLHSRPRHQRSYDSRTVCFTSFSWCTFPLRASVRSRLRRGRYAIGFKVVRMATMTLPESEGVVHAGVEAGRAGLCALRWLESPAFVASRCG